MKQVTGHVTLQILSSSASPAPPVGTSLGPRGINLIEFCKSFNEKTRHLGKDTPVPVIVTIYSDRSFSFLTKEPPVSYLLKKAACIEKGSKVPGLGEPVGQVTMGQLSEIAKRKKGELNSSTLEGAVRVIRGSARSLGLKVLDGD